MKTINEIKQMSIIDVMNTLDDYQMNEFEVYKKGKEISLDEIECYGTVYNLITPRRVPTIEECLKIDYACILRYQNKLRLS